MKYIRTKNGICELGELGFMYPKDYKTANTIEELCDEFVGILPNEKPYLQFYRTMYTFDKIKAKYLRALSVEPKTECYGAIWTNKGLIYVAKMNEKGELELL